MNSPLQRMNYSGSLVSECRTSRTLMNCYCLIKNNEEIIVNVLDSLVKIINSKIDYVKFRKCVVLETHIKIE